MSLVKLSPQKWMRVIERILPFFFFILTVENTIVCFRYFLPLFLFLFFPNESSTT